LIKKNEKIKTENSFHAKSTAINLLRDPSRQGKLSCSFHSFSTPVPCLPDRSPGLHTWFITLFCCEKNLRSVPNTHRARSGDRPFKNFAGFQSEDSSGGKVSNTEAREASAQERLVLPAGAKAFLLLIAFPAIQYKASLKICHGIVSRRPFLINKSYFSTSPTGSLLNL
jgi:hypothetical protein